MATARASGITVNYPNSFQVRIAGATAAGLQRRMRGAAALEPRDVVLDGLSSEDLMPVGEVILSKPAGRHDVRGPGDEVTLEVDVGATGDAVLLLESDGTYAWQFPSPQPETGRRAISTARFVLGGAAAGTGKRGPVTALVGAWLLAQATKSIRAHVFRFIAKTATAKLAADYEAKVVTPGLVQIAGFDPAKWIADGTATLPSDGAARNVLLLIHGTISSTSGSFGALADHAAGRAFLASAYDTYDTVLGYDHSTLGQVPGENADDVLKAIAGLPAGTTLDIIAFSRGGLVARILTERLLAAQDARLKPRRVIFVGCTNGGTHLAEPDNLRAAIDAYTNAIAAGARAAALVPGLGFAMAGASIGMEMISGLVRLVSQAAIIDQAIPGVAAMQPGVGIVKELNSASSAAPEMEYYAVTSNFVPTADKPGFTNTLVSFVLNEVTDRIFNEAANDLVVDTESMTEFGNRGGMLKGQEDYGATADVYHTIYFTAERVARKLSAWLGFPALANDYSVFRSEVSADMPMDVAIDLVDGLPLNAPVVISRKDGPGEPNYFYVRRVEDFAIRQSARMSVHDAFNLREKLAAKPHSSSGTAVGGGIAFSREASVAPLDDPAPADQNGDVTFASDGTIVAVRLPPSEFVAVTAETMFHKTPRGDGITHAKPPTRGMPDAITFSTAVEDQAVVLGRIDLGGDAILEGLPSADAGEPADVPAPSDAVPCHFGARMEPYPHLGADIPVVVSVSREELTFAVNDAAARTEQPIEVDAGNPIMLSIVAQENCEVVGGDAFLVQVPAAGKPVERKFMVRGAQDGRAKIIVEARQGVQTLAQFQLRPVFVDTTKRAIDVTATARVAAVADGSAEPAVLRVFEITQNGRVSLQYTLESRDPSISITQVCDLASVPALKTYVSNLYTRLEQSTGSGLNYDRFYNTLRAEGRSMARTLLPDKIHTALWQHRDAIRAIQIVSDEALIPWELMYVQDPNGPPDDNGFLCQWGMVRWLHNAPWPGRSMRLRNAYSVIPDYAAAGLNLAGAAKEADMLKRAFPNLTPLAADSIAIETFLNTGAEDCDVLHFACHGEAIEMGLDDARLHLSGSLTASGEFVPDYLTSQQVEGVRFAPGRGPLVFLNACQTGRPGTKFVRGVGGLIGALITPIAEQRGARSVVGTLWSVSDADAVPFAEAFYKHLGAGETLVDATKLARNAARPGPTSPRKDMTWLAYTVYGDPFARMA